ncbi:hypothetical protein DM01DRAFT_1322582 [Hesseltinella vesiculosa]|uniref:J domain-containing protein n=1 Tax=Hesseltinella vesiculosa TaxID=101127 RepID=A0A1X2GH04_9FUNG|nr:hypothetical protein DM01DRAFT_1322582 [Hesseltinella vesiculosa]
MRLELRIKQLEEEKMQQEHEIISLNNKNRHLEEDLEKAQGKIEQLKTLESEDDDLKKANDAAQRRITLLEQELEESDKSLKDTTANFREADVKAEHFERKVQQLENMLQTQELKNEEILEKNKDLQKHHCMKTNDPTAELLPFAHGFSLLLTFILCHPDRNKRPDAEEMFKTISEAYQILRDDTLRKRYDQFGRTPDLEADLVDGRYFFDQVYGGKAFKEFIGDLNVGKVVGVSDSSCDQAEQQKRVEQLAYEQQDERVESLIASFLKRIETFEEPASATFQKQTWQRIEELLPEGHARSILTIVGRLYVYKAKEFLGMKCGLLPGYAYSLREKNYIVRSLWTAVKSSMDANQASEVLIKTKEACKDITGIDLIASTKAYIAVWNLLRFEIEATLRTMCDRLLKDSSVTDSERQRRAYALLYLGNTFMARPKPSAIETAITSIS